MQLSIGGDTPVIDAGFRFVENELHRTVYSCTRIPARALLHILEVNLQQVIAFFDEWCDVHTEGVVSVSPVAGFLAVDEYRRLCHSPVKEQFGMFVALGDGQ